MKKLFFVFGVMLCLSFSAQTTEQKQLIKDVHNISVFLKQKEYNRIIDLTYPPVVEMVGKENFIKVLKVALEGDNKLKIRIYPSELKEYHSSEIFDFEENKYAFVSVPLNMEMEFVEEIFDEEKKKLTISMMELKGFQASFINHNTVKINALSISLAINNDKTKHTWKYINHQEDSPIYVSIFPIEILKRAKEYKAEQLLERKEKQNAN